MDLGTVAEIRSARDAGPWRRGDAWLAGGTLLFSAPRPDLTRLLDLTAMGWAPLRVSDRGLELAATCTIAELTRFAAPRHWVGWGAATGPSLVERCTRALSGSFKIWNVATVGGNLCAALPGGAMTALAAALDGSCTVLAPGGGRRTVPAVDLVTGSGTTALAEGELLRSVSLPAAALCGTTAFRQASLHPVGPSSALLIGRRDPDGSLVLTVTASTVRPVQLRFARVPDEEGLRRALEEAIPPGDHPDDVHGRPAWRRHVTLRLAEEIRHELAGGA